MIRVFLSLFLCLNVFAADAEKKTVPYLGPGADKLSVEEYERIYKNYIQTSILLGYSLLGEGTLPCEQSLKALFRQTGMFTYPVPAEAEQVRRSVKRMRGSKVETYEMAGLVVQVIRDGKNGALDQVILVNSASPKASRKLSQIVKQDMLALEKDPVTGLERVKGVPVGFPHPYLSNEGQGLYVKVLRFNKSLDHCEPLTFLDNTWIGGFDLSDDRCNQLKSDVEQVWKEKISPDEFSSREIKRMKDQALKHALSKGAKDEEAKALVDKNFVPPFTNQVNVVGSAMRNLAECNLLAIGQPKKDGNSASESTPGDANKGTGSAH